MLWRGRQRNEGTKPFSIRRGELRETPFPGYLGCWMFDVSFLASEFVFRPSLSCRSLAKADARLHSCRKYGRLAIVGRSGMTANPHYAARSTWTATSCSIPRCSFVARPLCSRTTLSATPRDRRIAGTARKCIGEAQTVGVSFKPAGH